MHSEVAVEGVSVCMTCTAHLLAQMPFGGLQRGEPRPTIPLATARIVCRTEWHVHNHARPWCSGASKRRLGDTFQMVTPGLWAWCGGDL